MMEVQSETDFSCGVTGQAFSPNYFINISNYLNKKIEISEIYEEEFGIHPFPRSTTNIRALATVRGAVAGFEYAEAFQLLKEIKE